jgi:hypothetical protein
MSNVSVERYDDFTGGLNLRADQFQLARNESPDMLNVEIDPRGGLFTRGAMREINSTAVTGTWNPHRLHAFYGASPRVMLATNTGVWHSSGTNFSQLSFGSGTPVVADNTHGASFANWGQVLYVATGTAGVATYTWETGNTYATAVPTIATAGDFNDNYNAPSRNDFPQCEHIIVHANKMFAAGVRTAGTTHLNRLHWSHEAEPQDWATEDYIDFLGGGDGIKALAVYAGQLIVFKPNSIYIVYGYETADFAVVELTARLGVDSPNKVAVAENGIYFYSHPNGLFFYNGSSIVDLSDNFNSIYPNNYVNDAATSTISVSYVNRRVWLSLPYSKTTTVSNATVNLIFDPSIGQRGAYTLVSTADNYGVIGGTDFTSSTGTTYGLVIHPNIPRVLRVDAFEAETDLLATVETNFTSYYRTGWVDGRSYSMKKMWRRPDIVIKQSDTARTVNVKVFHNFEEASGNERKTFDISIDASATGMLWGEGRWGSGRWGVQAEGAQVVRGSNLGLARSVQLLFTGPTGLSWGIDSISYKFNSRKVTG